MTLTCSKLSHHAFWLTTYMPCNAAVRHVAQITQHLEVAVCAANTFNLSNLHSQSESFSGCGYDTWMLQDGRTVLFCSKQVCCMRSAEWSQEIEKAKAYQMWPTERKPGTYCKYWVRFRGNFIHTGRFPAKLRLLHQGGNYRGLALYHTELWSPAVLL